MGYKLFRKNRKIKDKITEKIFKQALNLRLCSLRFATSATSNIDLHMSLGSLLKEHTRAANKQRQPASKHSFPLSI